MEPRAHSHLYDVSIDTLGLSDEAVAPLKRTGIVTIGDCIDFIGQIEGGMPIYARADVISAVIDAVKPALIEHGHGHYIEEVHK